MGNPTVELRIEDMNNTRWTVCTQNTEKGFLFGEGDLFEWTLLDDGSVVWGGGAGGFGIGGKWQLRNGFLELERTTLLGIVTGKYYYSQYGNAEVTEDLQFKV